MGLSSSYHCHCSVWLVLLMLQGWVSRVSSSTLTSEAGLYEVAVPHVLEKKKKNSLEKPFTGPLEMSKYSGIKNDC